MVTKEMCIEQYEKLKQANNGMSPSYREFLVKSGVNKHQLIRLFGAQPYTQLQNAAGDTATRLQVERTPYAVIMEQYGGLVVELEATPAYAEWDMRGLRLLIADFATGLIT